MGSPRQYSHDPHHEDVLDEIVRNALAAEGAGAPAASRPREIRPEIRPEIRRDNRPPARTENRSSVRIAPVRPVAPRPAAPRSSAPRSEVPRPAAPRAANLGTMHPAAAALFSAPTLIRELPRKRLSYALHVVKGLHLGARIPLSGSNMLVIGSGEDCDVILADEGVSAHHCVLTCPDGQPMVRVMDGVLTLEGREHGPGMLVELTSSAMVELGSAAFEVTASLDALADVTGKSPQTAGSPARAPAQEPAPTRPQAPPKGWQAWQERGVRILAAHRWALGVAGVVALTCVLTATVFRPATHPKPAVVMKRPQTVVKTEARPGPTIAQDVVEVLRLSGIASEGNYSGEGTVTVTGHLGDPRALEAIIQSRAMREISGLKRVVVTNLDYPGAAGSGTPVDGTRIVSAIDGKDPYVVTGDGSRYYVGATLPKGGKLVGVQAGEILVDRDGKVEHQKVGAPGAEGS